MLTILLIVINILVIFLFYTGIIHFIFKLFDFQNVKFKKILIIWWIQYWILAFILFLWFIIEFFFLSNANSPNDLDYLYFVILVSTIMFTIYYYAVTYYNIIESKKTILISFNLIYFLWIIWWFGISILFRMQVFNIFTVAGGWMESYLNSKNKVIVDKMYYKFNEVKRWDIIIFQQPNSQHISIKRVIWLPNEKIVIKDWNVEICNWKCEMLNEKYLRKEEKTASYCNIEEFEINNWYFVLWDNRQDSIDSRCCFDYNCKKSKKYTINKDEIIGKVTIVLTPHFKFE